MMFSSPETNSTIKKNKKRTRKKFSLRFLWHQQIWCNSRKKKSWLLLLDEGIETKLWYIKLLCWCNFTTSTARSTSLGIKGHVALWLRWTVRRRKRKAKAAGAEAANARAEEKSTDLRRRDCPRVLRSSRCEHTYPLTFWLQSFVRTKAWRLTFGFTTLRFSPTAANTTKFIKLRQTCIFTKLVVFAGFLSPA